MISAPRDARAGDLIRPALKKLIAFARTLRPLPGSNTRITQLPGGYLVSFDPPNVAWNHPFKCNLLSGQISVQVGLVNGVEPTIAGVPISGIDSRGNPIKGGAPTLTMQNNYDSESRAWIVARVTCDSSGLIKTAVILQISSSPDNLGQFQADHPICMIKNTSNGPVLYDQTFHNLGHAWLKPASAPGRHFFWAV